MDRLIATSAAVEYYASVAWTTSRSIVLQEFSHAKLLCMTCNAIYGAVKGSSNLYYWMHSLLLVVCGGFGGGITAPLLLGKPPVVMTYDYCLPLCLLAWYITHHLGLYGVLNSPPIKMIWFTFAMIFKTHSLCGSVTLANAVVPPGPYYPTAMMGPIVAGVVNGCMGMFYPFDKGLSAVQGGTPWTMQGAIIASTFFQLTVFDQKGIFGRSLRYFPLGVPIFRLIVLYLIGDLSDGNARLVVWCIWMILGCQEYILGQNANVLNSLYRILYRCSGVTSQDKLPQSFNWAAVVSDIRSIPVLRTLRRHLSPYLSMIQVAIVAIAVSLFTFGRMAEMTKS